MTASRAATARITAYVHGEADASSTNESKGIMSSFQRPRCAGPSAFGKLVAVPDSLPTIDREELWQKIEAGDRFVVVDALAPMSFAHSHLPGAINLPPEWVDDRGPRRIPDLET